ncbi:aldo/keto reductase [Azovibrio restrictus]|uniref:aldo/keto reductase n=1 Tax=Azovibrio restrictus TaxID=146938 RepID=UPI0026EA373D|nr:aldo/keto reductase [Azovibrio restrictus]MDD3481982.1 aldo/keto reductase [Azovibrio restrictus]
MQTRFLGQQQQPVSSIGLGCMGMSEFYGASDDAESLRTLARALELGINFFDSADTYGHGHNESLLGRFLKEGGAARRQQVVIASKFGIVREQGKYERRIDNSPAYIRQACEASLRRLGVEQIDLYYCHRRNPEVPIEEMMGALAQLVAAGKVRQIGLSEVSAATLRQAGAVHPVAAVQSEYSLWTREAEREMLATCAELGTTFVAYSPLGRAFLTGAVHSEQLAEDDFRKHNPHCGGIAQPGRTRRTRPVVRLRTGGRGAQAWWASNKASGGGGARRPRLSPDCGGQMGVLRCLYGLVATSGTGLS